MKNLNDDLMKVMELVAEIARETDDEGIYAKAEDITDIICKIFLDDFCDSNRERLLKEAEEALKEVE